MRAVSFDGHRDSRVPLPTWVSVHAASDVLIVATCGRCKGDVRIDLHCGSAEKRTDAERALGRFARWHKHCQPRVRVQSRRTS